MDGLIALLVLAALAVPAAGFVALAMVMRLRGEMAVQRRIVAQLCDRVAALETAGPVPAAATVVATSTPEAVEAALAETARSEIEPEEIGAAEEAPSPQETPAIDLTPAGEAEAGPTFATPAGLEERIGTRWAVWVGGAALALGLVFLVQYSIERGVFGPLARVILAGLASLGVVGLGEALRRRDRASGLLARFSSANVPAILTAAGAAGLFATVWGAHALYGFLGATAAFGLLGAVALATVAAALVHGPWLGVLGILGGFGAPLLVHAAAPRPGALVGFLLVVTAAAFWVASLRRWPAVAATAFAAAAAWGVGMIELASVGLFDGPWAVAHVVGLFALTVALPILGRDAVVAEPSDAPIDRFGLALLAASALLTLAVFDATGDLAGRIGLVAGLAGLVATAVRVPAVAPAMAIAGLLAPLAAGVADLDVVRTLDVDTFARGADGLVTWRPRVVVDWLGFHGTIAAALLAAGLLAGLRAGRTAERASGWFVAAGATAAVGTLLVAWGRVAAFESRLDFAAVGLALAAVVTAATARLVRDEAPDTASHGVAAAAVGTLAALAATLTIALDRAALTVALALMMPAIAFVWRLRPLPVLRRATALAAIVVAGRLAWDPALVDHLSTTPIFNALLLGWGVPALGAAVAARIFRDGPDDLPHAIMEGAAVAFTGLFALVEVRHWATGGHLLAPQIGVVELGLDAAALFVVSAGAQRIAGRSGSRVVDVAALALGTASAAIGLAGLLVGRNPLLVGLPWATSVGTVLVLGYGAPTVAGAVAARLARLAGRPAWYVGLLAVGSYGLGLTLVTLSVRAAFRGGRLAFWTGASAAELWTHSAAWLVVGASTLAAGFVLASRPLRLLSGLVVGATACKIFLIDLADAAGIWRAFSFLALGAVLIGIALVYQRLTATRDAPPPA